MPNIPQTSAVPETPKEVIIRTLASDLELMAKSGGAFTALKPVTQPTPTVVPIQTPAPADETKLIKIAVFGGAGILGVGILVLAGYYLMPLIFPPKIAPTPIPTLPTNQNSQTLPETKNLPSPVFTHQSFFRTPADQVLSLNLAPVTEAATLQTFGQQITTTLSGTDPNSDFFEIETKDANNKPISWTKFLSFTNTNLLTSEFFLSNFSQDFTAFIYRDKNGVWPGYVLQLNGNQNPLIFRSQMNTMESGVPVLQNLYLSSPGNPKGGFQDGQLVGEPIRTISFEQNGAIFAYGWFHSKYLILSTSLDGLKEAVKRL